MTETAYSWIRKVEDALEEAKIIPMWGGTPSFPWKEFSQQLAKLFQVKNFKISPKGSEWLANNKLLSGLGDNPSVMGIVLTPLLGNAYLALPEDDVSKLSGYLLTKDHSFKGFSDKSLKDGYFHFLILRAMQSFDSIHPFGELSPKLTEPSSFPETGAFCIDLSISLNSLKLWARLICTKELHQEFITHFALSKPSLLTDESSKQLEVPLHLEIGNTVLKLKEWKKVKAGDFLILDRCTFDPVSRKGNGNLVLGTTPFFQVRIKEEEIKIIDYAFYQEETIPMENNEKENNPPSDEELFLDEDFEEESVNEEPLDKTTENLISSQAIPLNLTIEVARLVMTVDKLLHLKPGNILELSVRPEQGVDITINGKKVAKGELVKLGEVLGVKILQIGE